MLLNYLSLLLLQLLAIAIRDLEASHRFLRIVNGKSIKISAAPWQISLQADGSHSCGGSILSSKVIVTAAHCVYSFNARQLKVRAGSTKWRSGGELIRVASYKTHPDFETETFTNDMAIVRLKRSLKLGRNAQSIELATREPGNGSMVSVTGWGDTGRGTDELPTKLQKVYLFALDHGECQRTFKTYRKEITKGMVCAAAPTKDACQGDSGGPLVANGQLVGIVSFGIGCAIEGIPGVYTNIPYYYDWLQKELKKC